MNEDSTTFGLSPKKLTRLWSIGSDISPEKEIGGEPAEQRKAELLRDWLSSTLPPNSSFLESMPRELCELCQKFQLLGGETFGHLLLDPKADISTIERIKRLCKKLVSSAKSKAESEVATAVYYASIASALIFHGQRITSFSYENLANSLASLAQNTWLTPDLVGLFEEARKVCQQKAEKQK